MSFDLLSGYLAKYKILTPPDEYIRKKISEIIKEECDITIPTKVIYIKNQTVFLKITPIQKSEIFLKKEKILYTINETSNKIKIKYIQ